MISFSLLLMIGDETLKRTLHDGAYLIALHLENERELLLIMPGDAAYKRHGQIFATIAREVVVDKIAKRIVDQLADALVVEMTMDELGERGQETVGLRLAINLIDNFGQLHARLALESMPHSEGEHACIEIVQQMLAKNGATALVAQNIAKGGGVVKNLSAIVDTRIGTRAKDAGDALAMTTKGATGSQQIAMGLDRLSAGEGLFNQPLDAAFDLGAHATAIEINGIDGSIAQLGQKIVLEHGTYLIIGHMKRVETHRVDLYLRGIATGLEAYPIGFCATTISYQYGHINVY